MQEGHPSFTPPEPEAALWRYIDFTKFVSLLDTQSLYLARADLLGDPFEGSYPAINLAARPHLYSEETVRQLRAATMEATRNMFISCWHEGGGESAAMWSLYSKEYDGIAIRTDAQSLQNSLLGPGTVHIGCVSYIDYSNTAIKEGNVFDPFLYKRREFEHEREVRAIRWILRSDEDRSALDLANPPNGLLHRVDLSVLVKGIIVAPYAEEWFADLVRGVASRYGLEDYVSKSSLAATPGW